MNYGERIGYLKPSKKDQNLEIQVQQLELEGIAHKKIFVDKQVIGKMSAFDRPAFSEMLQYIKTHNVSTLFVYELSQIERSFLNTLEIVQRLEEEFHVIVWSLSPKETWTQTADRSIRTLILAIFKWVVELERESVSERTKEGLAKARNEGKHIGHPFREINWKTVDECRERGISWSTISRILDIPYSTLIRARNRRFRETYLELGGKRPEV